MFFKISQNRFAIIVNGSIVDVAAVLDPPLAYLFAFSIFLYLVGSYTELTYLKFQSR